MLPFRWNLSLKQKVNLHGGSYTRSTKPLKICDEQLVTFLVFALSKLDQNNSHAHWLLTTFKA